MSTPAPHPDHLLGVDPLERWKGCDSALQALARGLEYELSPLLRGPDLPIPARKARLTRVGGRCVVDGAPLAFDPWSPHQHACPQCGAVYAGTDHDDWWAMSAQLWCAERALHAALLGHMWERGDLTRLATRLLRAISEHYHTYPNEDNALGPTRPFFSTYLESVWLLNTCLAAQVLGSNSESRAAVDLFCETVVEPSRALIASFPEGRSNRQAWHSAAQLAAAMLLGDTSAMAPLVDGPLGVHALIRDGLLHDGSWYEGENYHLFAHRGLWYGVTMLESMGIGLPAMLAARFDAGFCTPFLGVLPDGTFPSRRDSRYGVSVHQWRFAEWCELGLARHDHPTLRTWLHRLYNSAHASPGTDRAHSTADIERDAPPCALRRENLGWRTLMFARAQAWPAPSVMHDQSVVLEAQGLSIIRRDAGRIYVALEGGHTGGGHGHPDRLALTIQDGLARVLEDPGAGAYVERALHWYRSTLAHNAPLVNGRSQTPVSGTLRAFESRDDIAWMQVEANGMAPDVRVVRTVIVSDEHIVDHVEWWSPHVVTLDLPIHFGARVHGIRDWCSADAVGAGGLEDGFDFLSEVQSCETTAHEQLILEGTHAAGVRAYLHASTDATLFRAMAPGPPRTVPRSFHWLRQSAAHGMTTCVWSLRDSVAGVSYQQLADGTIGVHVRARRDAVHSYTACAPAWRSTRQDPSGIRQLTLAGLRAPHASSPERLAANATPSTTVNLRQAPATFTLGERHYRGSESSWTHAGQPTAHVHLHADRVTLYVTVTAHTGDVVSPAAGEDNPLDNERADINADGVQCYVGPVDRAEWSGGWLLVPDVQTGHVRVTCLIPSHEAITARWTPTAAGFALDLQIPRGVLPQSDQLRFDLLVNERPSHRQRRRGQLVLSGSSGETVYLRGDRHDPNRAWRLLLPSLRATDSSSDPQA